MMNRHYEERKRISDENRKNCSCNPINIAKRMREERERRMQLTPAQQDSIYNYYMNAPLFDTAYKPFNLLDSPSHYLYDPAVIDKISPQSLP